MTPIDWLRKTHNRLTQPWHLDVIQVVPANSPGPWSGSNAIGQEQAFKPDSNNTQLILKMDEMGIPVVWTISLGATYSDNAWPGAAGNLGVRAQIEIGVGGATQMFQVDWGDGTLISVPMNAVNIKAFYRGLNPGLPIKAPSDLRLSVILSRKPRSSIQSATFTDDLITIPFGAPIPFDTPLMRIPRYAYEMNVFPVNTGGVGGSLYAIENHIIFYESSNTFQTGGIPIMDITLDNVKPTTPIPIPGSAKYYNLVVDAAGGYTGLVTPVFNLSL